MALQKVETKVETMARQMAVWRADQMDEMKEHSLAHLTAGRLDWYSVTLSAGHSVGHWVGHWVAQTARLSVGLKAVLSADLMAEQ
jgi:hypothetical protein